MDLLKHQDAAIKWAGSCVTDEHFDVMTRIVATLITPDRFKKNDPEDVWHVKFKLYLIIDERRKEVIKLQHKKTGGISTSGLTIKHCNS